MIEGTRGSKPKTLELSISIKQFKGMTIWGNPNSQMIEQIGKEWKE